MVVLVKVMQQPKAADAFRHAAKDFVADPTPARREHLVQLCESLTAGEARVLYNEVVDAYEGRVPPWLASPRALSVLFDLGDLIDCLVAVYSVDAEERARRLCTRRRWRGLARCGKWPTTRRLRGCRLRCQGARERRRLWRRRALPAPSAASVAATAFSTRARRVKAAPTCPTPSRST